MQKQITIKGKLEATETLIEMMKSTHKRQEIVNQLDDLIKSDQFRFSQPDSSQPNTSKFGNSGRIKNSSIRGYSMISQPHNASMLGSNAGKLNSSRLMPRKVAGVTGIQTYLYEVKAQPLKESFRNSNDKRKRKITHSLKNCYKNSMRSKTGGKSRYHGHSRSRRSNFHHTSNLEPEVGNNHNISIFEKLPGKLQPTVSTSVDKIGKRKVQTNPSIDFKHLPPKMQESMQEKITQLLHKRSERIRRKPKQVNPYQLNYNSNNNALRYIIVCYHFFILLLQ